MKKWLLAFAFLMVAGLQELPAQCAMCRATLENNVANGDIGIAASINFGILYLFLMPYVAFFLVAFFWYRRSKAERLKRGHA